MSTDPDAVEIQGAWISSARLVAWLDRKGWIARGGKEGLYRRYDSPQDSAVQTGVLVPLDSSKEDYRDLLDDAVARLLDTTGIGGRSLVAELDVGVGDVIRFRKDVPAVHGSVPWTVGESHVRAATKILEASAKAERSKAAYFGNRNRTAAKAYLDSVRMGQTEPGSYVLIAFSPVDEVVTPDLAIPGLGQTATGRSVAETLGSALESTTEALDHFRSTASLDGFISAIERGVSYEFTKGIAGLLEGADGADIGIEWTGDHPPSRVASKFVFRSADIPILERASFRFAATEAPSRVTVIGTVTLLERPRPGVPGMIRLNVIDGSSAKKMRVRIPDQYYEVAIQAHREGKAIRLSGRQEKEGQQYWLYDPTSPDLLTLPDVVQQDLFVALGLDADDE